MSEAPPSYLIEVQRELGLRGRLKDFVEMAWPIVEPVQPFQDNWHIGAICEHLEALYRLEIKDLLIEIPPGCMKSLTTGVFYPVWEWLQEPGFRTINGSFDPKLSARDAGKSLKIIQSPWFRERWGDRVIVPSDASISDYTNQAAGFRFTTSPGGKGTGRHADRIGFDDPIKVADVGKKLSREVVRSWWFETMPSRAVNPSKFRKLGIMQRLHHEDLAALCAEMGYHRLVLPMRWEPTQRSTSAGVDPRTTEGELLWPERMPAEAVQDLETTLGPRAFAAQYQQRPSPESGEVFKREWFRFWRYPADPVGDPAREALPERFDSVVQSWDCTFKGIDTADYVVGQVWGKKGPNFYLLDQTRARMGVTGTLAAIRAMTRKWPQARTILIEDKANGSAVIEILKKEIPGIIPINPDGGKEARANAVTPLYAAGNIFYPPPERAPWVDSLIDEHLNFPTGAKDDQVDCGTQAINYQYQNTSLTLAAMRAWKRNGFR